MHANLKSNIIKSLVRISDGPKSLDKSEVRIIDHTGHKEEVPPTGIFVIPWATRIDPEIPWFVKLNDGGLRSPQEPIFGYYALRNIFRGILIGSSFIPGADILLNKYFLSPSITNYYASIFHLMFAYLSLEGRVIITPVYGKPYVEITERSSSGGHEEIQNSPAAICAILTRNNNWIFEGRARTHKAYWAELDRLLLETRKAPKCFIDFADYLTCYGPLKDKYSSEFKMVRASLEHIQNARHEAIYQGYGYDPWSHDQLTNRDSDYAPISLRAEKYRAFTYGLLNHILEETNVIVEHLKSKCHKALNEAKLGIAVSTTTPPFELRIDLTDLLDESIYNKNILSSITNEFFEAPGNKRGNNE